MIIQGTGVITLGPVVISDSMILVGDVESSQVTYEQKRTVEGYSSTVVYPKPGGRAFTLGSDLSQNIMGIWCLSTLQEVQALALLRIKQTLLYRGASYTVWIVDTSNVTPLYKNEPESATKAYTGTIKLIEA